LHISKIICNFARSLHAANIDYEYNQPPPMTKELTELRDKIEKM